MPKVSVIIPVYNVEKYLRRCLDSVVNQTLKDIEIICINDCSTDDSLKILQDYAKKDERIKIIDLEKNQDVSHARNIGIEMAKGEYIGFVDSDDTINLNFYENLYIKATETNSQVAKGLFKIIAGKHSFITDFNDKISLNKLNFFGEFTTAIYKTSFLKDNDLKFREDLKTWEDPLFTLQVTRFCSKIAVTYDAIYNYNRRPESKSHQVEMEDILNWFKAINLYMEIPTCENDYKLLLKFILNMFFTCFSNIYDKKLKLFAMNELQKILDCKKEYISETNINKLKYQYELEKYRLMANRIRYKIHK